MRWWRLEPRPNGGKSGEGRDLRLAVTISDEGERPARIESLADAAEAALAGIDPDLPRWRMISLRLLRRRVMRRSGRPWIAVLDYRARLLAE